jgi:hypothetical protein
MKRIVTILSTTVPIILAAAPVRADGLGIGAVTTLTGSGGISLTYDTEQFHVDGIFSLVDVADADLTLGGRFFYVVHDRAGADLSLGGGLGLVSEANDDIDFHIELGAKIRVFLVPNVAFHTTLGLGLLLDDDGDGLDEDVLVIDGQPLAIFGITYFFQ